MSQPHLSEDLKKELKEEKKEARKFLIIWPLVGFLSIGMVAFFWKSYVKTAAENDVKPSQQVSYPNVTASPTPSINPSATPAPSSTPTPETAEPTPTPASAGSKTHIVEDGDTFWSISSKYDVSIEAIKKANNITGDDLQIGQKLIIP
ncbi:MAG: Cell wall hydrolase [candidate division CPR2 bacterium GW2011_GWC1_39_9]|uniref:Cell wall hydrolase n=1 Tax=candidate division CPR2 bacterium GW2011_GWC2_39_10 TaxID=1618345 RepID=A0A0G0Q042_UNCC2|nr:MAG: Cell wall hydrolase [candidate division CPR2 bacterium GW2011_GWC2_39_10]KKR35645.1 MAG: Cell wall hydrolase [candidate division CPR2 bacterium GW2011_GWC1_39_9]